MVPFTFILYVWMGVLSSNLGHFVRRAWHQECPLALPFIIICEAFMDPILLLLFHIFRVEREFAWEFYFSNLVAGLRSLLSFVLISFGLSLLRWFWYSLISTYIYVFAYTKLDLISLILLPNGIRVGPSYDPDFFCWRIKTRFEPLFFGLYLCILPRFPVQ